MVVLKLNARDFFFTRVLTEKSAEACKSAADTIRIAEGHVTRSVEIVSQSELIVERARQSLSDIESSRRRRLR